MKIRKILAVALLFLFTCPCITAFADSVYTIYVSPDGSDFADGTEHSPYKTLTRARDYARYLRKNGTTGDIDIILKTGKYDMQTALYMDSRDSNIHFIGEDGACLSGAKTYSKSEFNALAESDSVYSRFPESARDKIKWVSLSEDFRYIDEIHEVNTMQVYLSDYIISQEGLQMRNARWPNEGEYFKVNNVYKSASQNEKTFIIGYDDENISTWSKPEEIFCEGFGDVLWKYQKIRLSEIDTAEKKITSGDTTLYSGVYVGGQIWFSNVAEELDEVGEWYIDRNEKKLYFYSDEKASDISVAKKKDPFFEIINAKNISFSNITLENTRANGVYINGGSGISFNNCSFCNIGGVALYIRKSYKCGISDSSLFALGNGGVIFSECGRKYDLMPSENFVLNNEICDFSRNIPTYSPAIWVNGIGDTISYNTIHEAFHAGIIFTGNDNIISHNEIFNVLKYTEDAGAIYTYGDGSSRGNIFEYNYIHHLGDGKKGFAGTGCYGIYFDNFNGGQIVRKNIFYDMPSAVHINSGGDNLIENNIFSEIDVPIYAHSYDTHPSTDMWNGYLKLYKNEEIWLSHYPELSDIPDPLKPVLTYRNNSVKNNVFSLSGSTEDSYIVPSGTLKENNIELNEEIFADKENFDFSLKCELENFTYFDMSSFGVQ